MLSMADEEFPLVLLAVTDRSCIGRLSQPRGLGSGQDDWGPAKRVRVGGQRWLTLPRATVDETKSRASRMALLVWHTDDKVRI